MQAPRQFGPSVEPGGQTVQHEQDQRPQLHNILILNHNISPGSVQESANMAAATQINMHVLIIGAGTALGRRVMN